jgi:enoyl-CoA hydratase/carnithine racemase
VALNYEVRDRIGYFSFRRPEKHNALRDEDLSDLIAALRKFDADKSGDIGIIYGEGPSFSSGADVSERLQQSLDEGDYQDRVNETDAILSTTNWKPLIAAVHGYCLGHALGTALLCDHVVAARSSRFQVTETVIGVPAQGAIARLGGGAFAVEVAMTGRFFTAEELNKSGALTKLVENGEHLSASEELARQILQHPQGAVRELVRYRRALVAESLQHSKSIAGTFGWVHSSDSADRIAAKLTGRTQD